MATIDVIEIKADAASAIDLALDEIPPELFPFFEIPIERDPRGLVAAMVDGDAGAKVRTGGASAEFYPTSGQLARFIAACAAANVPFKATAGLHHPQRHFSDALQTREHGFLNVFIAGALANTHGLSDADLARVLEEESCGAFAFSEDMIAWRDCRLRTADLEDAREEFAVSFGSCSFDEPRDDLRAMSLLSAQG
jgi:hypothetical protein